MLETRSYDRAHAAEYALKWALSRNPLFFDFEGIGGDCTNFASQCLLAGSCEMNYTPVFGWYYISLNERTASWSGVPYLGDFLLSNEGAGPFGSLSGTGGLEAGDVIQLGRENGAFYHTLVVTGFEPGDYLVSAHSYDERNRRLSTYKYERIRFIHIDGVRVQHAGSCFKALLAGESLPST